MACREREILEHAVRTIAEQAANTNKVIDEAMEAGLAGDHPVTVAAKQVRLEPLKVKADLEWELATSGTRLQSLRAWRCIGFRA